MSLVEASNLLKVSYRHTKRIYHRYLLEGDRGLVHQARGRPSNHQAPTELKEKAFKLYEAHFIDFGPTLGAEYLAKEFELVVKVSSFRRWLMTAGLWKRERKRKDRRQRRPRRRHLSTPNGFSLSRSARRRPEYVDAERCRAPQIANSLPPGWIVPNT